MRYSLLNRFRGVLLGGVVGEILGNGGCQGLVLAGSSLQDIKPRDTQPQQSLSPWQQIAAYGTKSLISCGRLDGEDWLKQINWQQSSLLALKNTASCSEAALATVPIAVFFHEDKTKLCQQLLQGVAIWQDDDKDISAFSPEKPDLGTEALVIGLAIAQALTEKLNPSSLLFVSFSPKP
ncbi:MAG: hypothetical protein F6K47_01790 [Symploca sp. SIO2E6]|nr:hypothetical protein [Symploca sp. SIO2E6]